MAAKKLIIEIPDKYRQVMLEALHDLLYKVSLDLSAMKGQPLTKERKQLTRKQSNIEELRHLILIQSE